MGIDLLQNVVEAREIVLRRLKPQLGFMTAGMQPRNACGLFKDTAALLRFGGNDLADLALPHHRRRSRAGRCVGEQQLHIAGAHLASIDPVGRARLALDAPANLDDLSIVKARWRRAVAIVEEKNDLRHIARRPVTAAGKNHIVHAGRAHIFRRTLAHHPAQRLDEIRFAAAVRPDNAGQPRLD